MNAELPLRDIHAALAPPWWPPAPGWWILAALLLVLLGLAAWRGIVALQRGRRRARLIDELEQTLGACADDRAFLESASDYLKRLLVHAGGRSDLAVESGSALATALQAPWDDREDFARAANAVAHDQYRPAPTVDRAAVDGLVRAWIDVVVQGARK